RELGAAPHSVVPGREPDVGNDERILTKPRVAIKKVLGRHARLESRGEAPVHNGSTRGDRFLRRREDAVLVALVFVHVVPMVVNEDRVTRLVPFSCAVVIRGHGPIEVKSELPFQFLLPPLSMVGRPGATAAPMVSATTAPGRTSEMSGN